MSKGSDLVNIKARLDIEIKKTESLSKELHQAYLAVNTLSEYLDEISVNIQEKITDSKDE